LHSGSSYTTRQVAFVHYGAKLTAQNHLDLSKALYTFLAAMDIRPKSGYLGPTTGPTNVAPYRHWCTRTSPSSYNCPFTTSAANYTAGFQGNYLAWPYACIRVGDPNYLNLHRFELHSGDVQGGLTGEARSI
jgi:hypothetical protein